jgi:hypothetical protein
MKPAVGQEGQRRDEVLSNRESVRRKKRTTARIGTVTKNCNLNAGERRASFQPAVVAGVSADVVSTDVWGSVRIRFIFNKSQVSIRCFVKEDALLEIRRTLTAPYLSEFLLTNMRT